MVFNSLAYAVFLPTVFVLYWLIPHKVRWPFLLAASYWFYMSWKAEYALLIAAATLVSYACALLLERTRSPRRRKLLLAAAAVFLLLILFLFKYFNFAADLLESLHAAVRLPRLDVLLPVGISFYTFQTLSYVIDVYRGKTPAERNLGVYAAFVSFFPQLVAGPIERSANLLPQLTSRKRFDPAAAACGVRLILWGLYKKMVIADNLDVYVSRVFDNVRAFPGASLLLAALFFSIQIYCDFSGYSDIARGSAKLLGIDLMENFRSPYFSAGIREFWSRWHISLSTWFRDYLYIPLGGNRRSKPRTALNQLITFLVSGLWHGANVTFLVWGGIHGLLQVAENLLGLNARSKSPAAGAPAASGPEAGASAAGSPESQLPAGPRPAANRPGRLRRILGVPVVFVLVTLAWVFFRAASLPDALYVLGNMLKGFSLSGDYFLRGMDAMLLNPGLLRQALLLYLLPLAVYDFFSLRTDIPAWLGRRGPAVRCAFAAALILVILIYGYVGKSTFVYFQF